MKVRLRCNLKDVGRRAGVTAATASLALRGDPRIPPVTRQKVQRAAKALGYLPDPVLSALIARRDEGRVRRVYANLAALVDDRWFAAGATPRWMEICLGAMERTCTQLGYHLEIIHIQRDLAPSSHPDRILQARGIRGVALLAPMDDDLEIRIDWERYAAVIFGNPLLGRRLNRVGTDAYAAMQMVCEKVSERGYRRIGWVNQHGAERRHRFGWLGALGAEHLRAESKLQVLRPYLPSVAERESFLRWMEKQHPDCVLTSLPHVYDWLIEAGYRIPRDLGFVLLSRRTGEYPHITGTSSHLEVAGAAVIEQLHAQLLRGEIGFPEVSKEILIYPRWVEGRTLRAVKKVRAKS